MKNIPDVTNLDYDQIRSNLKAFFQREDSPFRDWDFEGSGLNYMLDILAYNTHFNAVTAHVSMNETFLDSAQVRSNVVSRAKLLGYTPRSNKVTSVTLNIEFERQDDSTDNILTLPIGTSFVNPLQGGVVDDEDRVFQTIDEYTAIYDPDTNRFRFEGVVIYSGVRRIRTFTFDAGNPYAQFVIEDENVDTSTLKVRVYSHENTTSFTPYYPLQDFSVVNGDTNVFFLSEDYDGFYKVGFGDNVIGNKPENLSVVELEYRVTGDTPLYGLNPDILQFANVGASDDFANIAIPNPTFFEASSAVSGGGTRESIESIRNNAPISYISQKRAITPNDYKALVLNNFSDIFSVSSWGGQENDPPDFGKVFLSIQPEVYQLGVLGGIGGGVNNAINFSSTTIAGLTDLKKQQIVDFLKDYNMISIQPEIVDPDYLFLSFDIFVQYNKNSTNLQAFQIENNIKDLILEYNREQLGKFENTFHYSSFSSLIDDSNTSIVASLIRPKITKTLRLIRSTSQAYTVDFRVPLFVRDKSESVLSSTTWYFNNQRLYLADESIENTDILRRVYAYRIASDNTKVKVFSDLGTLNVATGVLELTSAPSDGGLTNQSDLGVTIAITAIPKSYDIQVIRNQIVTIDMPNTKVTASSELGFISNLPFLNDDQ